MSGKLCVKEKYDKKNQGHKRFNKIIIFAIKIGWLVFMVNVYSGFELYSNNFFCLHLKFVDLLMD